MTTKEYVESLFRDYEESAGLKDFTEELQSNLDARVANLVQKGMPENEAFDKACAELGDVSHLADELSLKKRREVFEDAYLDIRKYMRPGRVAAYVIFGATVLFGVIIAAIVYFSTQEGFAADWMRDHGARSSWGRWRESEWVAVIGSLMPFLLTSLGGFTFLGLTQETKSRFPMSKKRAAWYVVALVLIGFGLLTMLIVYFAERYWRGGYGDIVALISVLIPFVLPGAGLLTYLLLTEQNRFKPWAVVLREEAAKRNLGMWADPSDVARFRMFSRAIRLFAVTVFLLVGFLAGFKYSWPVLFLAVAGQLLLQGFMTKKK